MKTFLALAAVFVLASPAFAVFEVGSTETFNGGLGGWYTKGDVVWAGQSSATLSSSAGGDRLSLLGRRASNTDNRMWCYFVAPTSGEYAISFDYKFTGVDNAAKADDFMSAGIADGSSSVYSYGAASSSGLTGSDWRTVNSQPVTLTAGQKYAIAFGLNESRRGGRRLVTALDVDNINISTLSKVRAIPAPGAILLSSIGVGLVGWLRGRKVL